MMYRVLGRTGLHVSELGVGGHEYRRWLNPNHFNVERDDKEFYNTQEERNILIKRALDVGINYFDTTLREEVESLGISLKKWNKRKDAIVAIMVIFPFRKLKDSPESMWRDIILDEIDARLKLLYTDYADIFNVHMPEDNYTKEYFTFVIELLKELKGMGKIRAIGASTHEPAFIAELIRKYDCFDTVMVRYNYFMKEAKDILFPTCRAHNVGVVVMKPIAWPYYGIPIPYFKENDDKQYDYTPAQASIKWILNTQEVSTIVSSVNSIQELEENINTFSIQKPVDERILEECLQTALSEKGKEILIKLTQHPYKDISGYAKKALEGWKVI